MPKVSGVAMRVKHLERLLDRTWKIADYWKVRALRAEGYDVPTRPHPGLEQAADSGSSDQVTEQ